MLWRETGLEPPGPKTDPRRWVSMGLGTGQVISEAPDSGITKWGLALAGGFVTTFLCAGCAHSELLFLTSNPQVREHNLSTKGRAGRWQPSDSSPACVRGGKCHCQAGLGLRPAPCPPAPGRTRDAPRAPAGSACGGDFAGPQALAVSSPHVQRPETSTRRRVAGGAAC